MLFVNVAVIALVSFVYTTTVLGAGLDQVARVATPESRTFAVDTIDARQEHAAWHNQEFNISPRQASAQSAVTVTVTTIPDYCRPPTSTVTVTSLPTVCSVSVAPQNVTVPIPTGGVPKISNSTVTAGGRTATLTVLSATSTSSNGANQTTSAPTTSSAPITPASNDTPSSKFSLLALVITLVVMITHSVYLI